MLWRRVAPRPSIEHDSITAEVGSHRLVPYHLNRHQYRERCGIPEVRGDVALIGGTEMGVGEATDRAINSSAVDAVTNCQSTACVKRIRHPSEKAYILDKHSWLAICPLRPEFCLLAVHVGKKDLSRLEPGMLRLSYGKSGHSRGPFGYLIPDDAADEDNVAGKVVMIYLGRHLEVHRQFGVFGPNVAVLLYQRI
jgi:hypothetical protein